MMLLNESWLPVDGHTCFYCRTLRLELQEQIALHPFPFLSLPHSAPAQRAAIKIVWASSRKKSGVGKAVRKNHSTNSTQRKLARKQMALMSSWYGLKLLHCHCPAGHINNDGGNGNGTKRKMAAVFAQRRHVSGLRVISRTAGKTNTQWQEGTGTERLRGTAPSTAISGWRYY